MIFLNLAKVTLKCINRTYEPWYNYNENPVTLNTIKKPKLQNLHDYDEYM